MPLAAWPPSTSHTSPSQPTWLNYWLLPDRSETFLFLGLQTFIPAQLPPHLLIPCLPSESSSLPIPQSHVSRLSSPKLSLTSRPASGTWLWFKLGLFHICCPHSLLSTPPTLSRPVTKNLQFGMGGHMSTGIFKQVVSSVVERTQKDEVTSPR